MTSLLQLWKHYPRYGLAWLAVMLAGYVLVIALTLALRFQEWPNYSTLYAWWDNLALIISGTPAWRDTLPLLLEEPLWEIGYKNPDYYGIAEWNYTLIPLRFLALLVAFLMLTTIVLHYRQQASVCAAGPVRRTLLIGSGSILGITSATVSWVVCCATPTWAVFLSLLGLNASLALQLDPLGGWLFGLTFLTLLLWLAVIALQLSRTQASASRPFSGEIYHGYH